MNGLTRRRAIGAVLLGCAAGLACARAGASSAAASAERRIAGRSHVIGTRQGQLEYALAGDGPPLLMIHGTGGGFDQGLTFSTELLRLGHRIVAPSRFGYLRTDFPPDPSSENQADALVELLDHLGIDRLPVAGGSAGALSAVQLALRHPDRCSGLILLVPAANVRGQDPAAMSAATEFVVRQLLSSDFLFWSALETMPKALIGSLLATDPKLLATVSPAERRRAYRILEELMPVSRRSRGMLNDARLAGSPGYVDFTALKLPSLIVSVEDDRFGTAETARWIAAQAPGSRLVIFPSGGHIWLGHDRAVAESVHGFVSQLEA